MSKEPKPKVIIKFISPLTGKTTTQKIFKKGSIRKEKKQIKLIEAAIKDFLKWTLGITDLKEVKNGSRIND